MQCNLQKTHKSHAAKEMTIKLAFHDADTNSDSPDTSDVGVGVRVGVVECQLNDTSFFVQIKDA